MWCHPRFFIIALCSLALSVPCWARSLGDCRNALALLSYLGPHVPLIRQSNLFTYVSEDTARKIGENPKSKALVDLILSLVENSVLLPADLSDEEIGLAKQASREITRA